jgi:soluble cytochrome b562
MPKTHDISETWEGRMIINNSFINLEATHSLTRQYNLSEQLSIQPAGVEEEKSGGAGGDLVSISAKAYEKLGHDLEKALKHLEKHMSKMDENPEKEYRKAMKHLAHDLDRAIKHLEKFMGRIEEAGHSEKAGEGGIEIKAKERLDMIGKVLEALTGREMSVQEREDDHGEEHRDAHGPEKKEHEVSARAWDISYSRSETYTESEQMTFNAGGVVRTADGRQINFSLDLMMSRQYMAEQNIDLNLTGIRADDIVVNLDAPASELENTSFGFAPADNDGDSISYLSLGGGVLSLDLNGDGVVNDLSEVVGAESSNGFSALAAYDEDGNGWIDEADPVFGSLGLYDEAAGMGTPLTSLQDAGVGAIYLGSVESPYSIMSDGNAAAGSIERSGLYLAEDGTPGTVQQLSVIV